MKFQVLLQLRAAVYVEADSQADAESLAEQVVSACAGVRIAPHTFNRELSRSERHDVMIDEGEVVDVDEV